MQRGDVHTVAPHVGRRVMQDRPLWSVYDLVCGLDAETSVDSVASG